MAAYRSKAFVYLGRPGQVEKRVITVACGPRDLLVKVIMCARCGSDKTIYRMGHSSVDPYAPVVLGHELVATIVEVGSEVHTLKEGLGYCAGETLSDEYLDFRIGQRLTFQSRIARYNTDGMMLIPQPIANLSFQFNGGYAEYMAAPETMIRSGSALRVPDNVSDEAACLVEPAACALEAIFASPHAVGVDEIGRHIYRAGIKPHGNVCIIGSGTVGMIYAALALLEGAGRVVMVARSQSKKKLIENVLGDNVEVYVTAAQTEQSAQQALAAQDAIVGDLADLTGGALFDDVIAACASTGAQRLMLELYAPEGYAV